MSESVSLRASFGGGPLASTLRRTHRASGTYAELVCVDALVDLSPRLVLVLQTGLTLTASGRNSEGKRDLMTFSIPVGVGLGVRL